ncbi:MAG: radical SAM protein, partial [Proteobacteria bacterium]|nr:radical SAM protein [Pseudomonadota bacterium]
LPVREIGFTGGEPLMNRHLPEILAEVLNRRFEALVLTNAMQPLWQKRQAMKALHAQFGNRLKIRVSIDHHSQAGHERLRGERTWAPLMRGLEWLAGQGFCVDVAGRTIFGEAEAGARLGYQALFDRVGLSLNARDPARLVLFPEMDETADTPEITTACWDILGVRPDAMMCASSRMVVKRRGAIRPAVVACTLVPYDRRFEMGPSLAGASGPVALNHPHCSRFCVLGGGTCIAR